MSYSPPPARRMTVPPNPATAAAWISSLVSVAIVV
jgi:hypothetical protein